MLGRYLIGVAVIAALALVWVCVQNAWRTTFADVHPVGDVLTGLCPLIPSRREEKVS